MREGPPATTLDLRIRCCRKRSGAAAGDMEFHRALCEGPGTRRQSELALRSSGGGMCLSDLACDDDGPAATEVPPQRWHVIGAAFMPQRAAGQQASSVALWALWFVEDGNSTLLRQVVWSTDET